MLIADGANKEYIHDVEVLELVKCTESQLLNLYPFDPSFKDVEEIIYESVLCPDFTKFKVKGSKFASVYLRPVIYVDIPFHQCSDKVQ